MSYEGMGEAPKIAHDLAEGFSTQAKYSNKVWLALIAASMLVVFPDLDPNTKIIKLPFALGSVDAATYQTVGFLILSVLMISYCQSYGTTHLVNRVAHKLISEIRPEKKRLETRRYYDLLITSTLARVAPLVQLTGMQRPAAIYYLMLKLLAVTVLFAIPFSAILLAYTGLKSNTAVAPWIHFLSFFSLVVTSLATAQVLYIELHYVFRVTKLYWSGELNNSISKNI